MWFCELPSVLEIPGALLKKKRALCSVILVAVQTGLRGDFLPVVDYRHNRQT